MENSNIQKLLAELLANPTEDWAERLARLPGVVNLYQEITMRSRYVDTQRDSSTTAVTVQLHSHTFYEIIYCQQGNIQYLLGPNRYHIGHGDILFIPPGLSHRPLLSPNMAQPYDRYVIWLSKDFWEMTSRLVYSNPSLSPDTPVLLHTAGARWAFLGELFAAGVRETERQDPSWEAIVIGNTLQILAHLHRAMMDTGTISLAETPDLLDRILAYIEQHLAEKITLEQVAKHFLVSKSKVSHLFQQQMGVSFYNCVIQRRLSEAKMHILSGTSVEQAARAAGFSDYSTFYRIFKREYGISPTQYKNL